MSIKFGYSYDYLTDHKTFETLSIFNYRTLFFAQIVENRETRLSRPFLGHGDNFIEKL